MRWILTLTMLVVVIARPATADTIFVATIDGASNVPALPTVTSTGTAVLTLNEAQTRLTYHIELFMGDCPELYSHIHNAAPRENGNVVHSLPVGDTKDGFWDLPPDMVTELFAGRLYINVHTEAYITGEIRGNIQPQVPVQESSWGSIKARYVD
jgi:hypothetical protein